tara:strand:- start:395 stop:1186 length:792 start_codon:yes stop_codon:yes gene_type:complete
MSEMPVLFERDGNVGIIRLNRPQAMNALTKEMMISLMHIAIECDEDPDIRAVVLTGAGDAFCAGADLKAFLENPDALAPLVKELTVYIHAAISRLVRMDAPVVLAVNGMAAGGGFSLTLIGDVTYAAERARFTMAYTASGLSPDASSTFFLPRLVGLRRARHLALTNRRLDAEEARDWGLVDEVVPDAALEGHALATAQTLAAGPTASFGSAKRLMLESLEHGLEAQMELEAREIAANAAGEDVREGIRAFVEKRPAAFRGHR